MNYTPHWNLSTIPEDALKSEWARRSVARRQKAVGPPKVLHPCPKCGVKFGVRDLRKHKPRCVHEVVRMAD